MSLALRRIVLAAAALALVLPLAACVSEDADRRTGSPVELLDPVDPPEVQASQLADIKPAKLVPLRDGEQRMTLTMDADYTPSAPNGVGTDDYRCFLLDPHLTKDTWLTGTNVLPGNPSVVHHVILFQVPPDKVAEAESLDAETPDEGWTCFGGSGLSGEFTNLDDASWLGAWAPGGKESLTKDGYGVKLAPGSRMIMQVHYNLLAGAEPDRSSTQIRVMPGRAALTPVHTYLMPAPVEMPCRPDHDDGPLCDRDAAVADVLSRFGSAGNTNSLLHLLCGTDAEAVQHHDLHPHRREADDDPRRRRPHAPARPLDQDRRQPGHAGREDHPRHPGLGLRQPGHQADRPGAPGALRHRAGHLPSRPVAA